MQKELVVELIARNEDLSQMVIARFILLPTGNIKVIQCQPSMALNEIIQYGIPGINRSLNLADGKEFLDRLPQLYSSDYLFATEPFEMDKEEAEKNC